jgi:hypothetical protein
VVRGEGLADKKESPHCRMATQEPPPLTDRHFARILRQGRRKPGGHSPRRPD